MYNMLLVEFLRHHAQADDVLAKVMDQCGINVLESDCTGEVLISYGEWVDVEFEVALDSGSIANVCQ